MRARYTFESSAKRIFMADAVDGLGRYLQDAALEACKLARQAFSFGLLGVQTASGFLGCGLLGEYAQMGARQRTERSCVLSARAVPHDWGPAISYQQC